MHRFSKFAAMAAAVVCCVGASSVGFAQGRPDMWAGAYVGLNLGVAQNYLSGDNVSSTVKDLTKFNGFDVGGHAGYNWQSGQFVYGVEVDASGQLGKRSNTLNDGYGTGSVSISAPAMASARVRLGYAWDNMLVYGTVGGVQEQIKTTESYVGNPGYTRFNYSQTDTTKLKGYTLGLGGEYKMSQQLSLRLEARHSALSDGNYVLGGGSSKARFNHDAVQAGLSYHFN
jgi:outer membrane immunogenic protein